MKRHKIIDDIYPYPIDPDPLWMVVLNFLLGRFMKGL